MKPLQITCGAFRTCFFLALFTAHSAFSQVGDQPPSEVQATPEPEEDPYIFLFERMQNRLQSLESTVADLQGRVEFLEYDLEETKIAQQRRLADMDRRLRNALDDSFTNSDQPSTPIVQLDGGEDDEGLFRVGLQAYQVADYALAQQAFDDLVGRYPNSRHLPEVLFFLADIYVQSEPQDFESARQKLVQIIGLFPEHENVPDALFKLGTVYHQLGDVDRALWYFERVKQEHPEHRIVASAIEYAAALQENSDS